MGNKKTVEQQILKSVQLEQENESLKGTKVMYELVKEVNKQMEDAGVDEMMRE